MPVADVPSEVRVADSLRQAWTNMWPVFWILLGITLVSAIVSLAGQPSQFLPTETPWQTQLGVSAIGLVVSVLVGGPLSIGVVNAHLKASRGESPQFSDLAYGFQRYPQAVLLTLLAMLIVIGGLILLIIPGIYFGVKLSFTGHRFVYDELDAMDAIRASWDDVKRRWWRTFGLALMSLLLAIAGLLALVVGVFVADVLMRQMSTVYWRSIEAGGQ